MNKITGLSIVLVLFLTRAQTQCGKEPHLSTNIFYSAVSTKLEQAALNCTYLIPEGWRKVMLAHEPPNDPTGGQMLVEYLLACLHENRKLVNEASPFSLSPLPNISYDISLNQVVSLGFDGTLTTKALRFNHSV